MKTILRLVALVVAAASVALLAPGLASANKGRINDRRDARTPLDIASVSYGHAGGKIVHTLRTYKPFASKLLKGSNGIHFLLDVNNDARAERMVVVVWTGHALRADLIDEHGSLIGRVPVSRPDLRTVRIKLARSAVDNGPIYRWAAATLFQSRTTCRKGCVDGAPNRGFLKHRLYSTQTLDVDVVGEGDDSEGCDPCWGDRVGSSPEGIACRAGSSTGNGCSADFKRGTTVTLTATPSENRIFMRWSGACTGTGTCRVKLTHDAKVVAWFGRAPTVRAIDCISSAFCVAVGRDGNLQPLVLVGNPTTWSATNAKEITLGSSFGSGGDLSSIECTSTDYCVAVGGDGNGQPLVLAGDPATWNATDAKEITLGIDFGYLGPSGSFASIACTSSTSCVAVGGDGWGQPLVLSGDPATWNGSQAREIDLGRTTWGNWDGGLTSIACTSSSSCVAVGENGGFRPLVMAGDPATWTAANAKEITLEDSARLGGLDSVVCTSSVFCVAVGHDGYWRLPVLAGDPATWTAATEITLGTDLGNAGALFSVACTSSTSCVAVGWDGIGRSYPPAYQPLQLAGDPATWSATDAKEITLGEPFGSGGSLSSIACTSPTSCVAVGADGNHQPLVLAGDPNTWSAANAKEIALTGSEFGAQNAAATALACPSATSWSVSAAFSPISP